MKNSKEISREALLEAAKELFAESGYDSVSTRDIAGRAKVNLGAIQYHFGSKANLFIECVRSLMKGAGAGTLLKEGPVSFSSREEAAQFLCSFIYSIFDFVLHPVGASPSRIMIREVFAGPSRSPQMFEALVSSVVDEFIRPVDDQLCQALKILSPGLDENEIALTAHSIAGQCLYYFTNAPFIERLRGKDYSKSPDFEKAARHIARFSLQAIGCSSEIAESVTMKVFEGD